jgi:hypothetical protein
MIPGNGVWFQYAIRPDVSYLEQTVRDSGSSRHKVRRVAFAAHIMQPEGQPKATSSTFMFLLRIAAQVSA